ncbi:MAG: dienelactone hydrolase family protein [Tannerella sp.]|nr:dienelactone hydrolase family protein [Tannerella sp.]
MKKVFKTVSGICLTLALCCCSKPKEVKITLSGLCPVTIPAEPADSIIEIKNWIAIGPFEFQPLFTDPAKTFFRKDLKRYGIKEGAVDEAALEKLQKKGVNVFLMESPPPVRLFEYVWKNAPKKSNFYLVTRIYSAEKQEVTLIADGSYSYAMWLNGEKLVEERVKYNINKAGNRFINVSLKKGENILSVKINRGTNMRSWDLITVLTSRREAQRIFRVNYAADFAVNPIINHSLEVYAGPYSSGKVEIRNDKGETVAGGSFDNQNTNGQPFAVSDLKKLEAGFYKTILTVGGEKLEEMIYKGDYPGFVKKMKAAVATVNQDSLYINDLTAAMQRVDYLNGKPGDSNSPGETRFLNRNRVFWGYSLNRMLQKDVLTQLMTYTDENNDPGIFIFHTGNRQQKVPLVIIVPSGLEGNSMIEDWYTSNLDQIETDNALADEYGFAVAWIYAGGKKYSDDKTEQEITAIIDRLSSEGLIDGKRIFITGDCEGGRRALLQLAATPNRYAGCAVSGPVTILEDINESPIDLLPQMGKVPIFIEHGVDDNIVPIENSFRFYAEAQKLDLPVEFVEVGGSHVSISKDNHRALFEFFSRMEHSHKK